MAITLKKANFAQSTIASQLESSATSISLSSGTGALFPSSGSFRAVLWGASYTTPFLDTTREIITASFSSGDTFTLTRAQESTTAKTWLIGSNFALVLTKGLFDEYDADSLSTSITDPGNAGSIAVTSSGTCQLVTAGAETRTLGSPTYVGQRICLCCKTYVGDCVVAVASTVNVTGNNRITFSAARQFITLLAIQSGANIVWGVASIDSCSLSTV